MMRILHLESGQAVENLNVNERNIRINMQEHTSVSKTLQPHSVNDIHVSGFITIALELFLCLENLLPVLVMTSWRQPRERTTSDKLIAALSATYVMSALVPTPLGLVSYFYGSWYGGPATCECFQVTSTWCSLSALAIVTSLSVDLHIKAMAFVRSSPRSFKWTARLCCLHGDPSSLVGSGVRDCTNVLLFFIFTIALGVASLPVVGYGPEVMPRNDTCDSWLVDTPASGQGKTYLIAFLAFGFVNLLVVLVNVIKTMVMLSFSADGKRVECQYSYTESPSPQIFETVSSNDLYKMAGLVSANHALWIPALVIITIQKVGYTVSDATMMYAILSTSLPGLLNPLLLGLLFRDFRLGYRYVLSRMFCCARSRDTTHAMEILQSHTETSSEHIEDAGDQSNGLLSSAQASSIFSGRTNYACACADGANDDTDIECRESHHAYVVLEKAPNERTPLQGIHPSNVSRPIIASLYDEFGELGEEPKTELLSPCNSEECLLNPEIFRVQGETVV